MSNTTTSGPFTSKVEPRSNALGQAIFYHSSVSRTSYSACAAKVEEVNGAEAVLATAEKFYKFLTQEGQ